MGYAVKDVELLSMSEKDRSKTLADLVAAANAPRNGQALRIDARIRKYELRYEMSSNDLLAKLAANTVRETAEIADWLFWIGTRDNTENGQART